MGFSLFLVLACEGKSGEDKGEDTPGNYACLVCADPDEFRSGFDSDDWADDAECDGHGTSYNPNSSCVIDGEAHQVLSLSFDDCERAPACVGDDSLLGMGGSLFGEWDYTCEICGGDSEVDRAFDGGSEDSGCTEGSTARRQGKECPSGDRADFVFLSDCDEVPACAQ